MSLPESSSANPLSPAIASPVMNLTRQIMRVVSSQEVNLPAANVITKSKAGKKNLTFIDR